MKIEKLEIRNFGKMQNRTLVFSDAFPLHASASAGTEKSAVQNETVSGTENGTETKTKRAAVYVNLKTGKWVYI